MLAGQKLCIKNKKLYFNALYLLCLECHLQATVLCLGGTVTVTLVSERKRSEADTQTQNFKG